MLWLNHFAKLCWSDDGTPVSVTVLGVSWEVASLVRVLRLSHCGSVASRFLAGLDRVEAAGLDAEWVDVK